MRRLAPWSLLLCAAVFLAGCGSDSTTTAKPLTSGPTAGPTTTLALAPSTTVAVQKDVLDSEVDPPGAAGRTLTLIRYTIAAGAQLAPHVHPGVQMASIQSGSLTYTVVSGTATVRRAPAGTVEELTGPATTTLQAGDAVVEKADMVHFGANKTADQVVILATLLTENGADLAIPVTTIPPSPTG